MTIYMANPSREALPAMLRGELGYIDTPRQGNVRPAGVVWCADNGCFSSAFDEAHWWAWLERNAHAASSCLFATAPDVVGDAWATQRRSAPWLERIRELGYPVAYVLQNGARGDRIPWDSFDVLFIGGSPECLRCRYVRPQHEYERRTCPSCGQLLAEYKLGSAAASLVRQALRYGKRVHMGRVNSGKRFRYAESIGCDSVDGTTLTRGPAKNLPKVLSWMAAEPLELGA